MSQIVYFSSRSENTHRFVGRLGMGARRIPLSSSESLQVEAPYVLILPTYSGEGGKGAVPKQVIRFLNDAENRGNIRGVIAAGNSNFGATYGIAGDVIPRNAKCRTSTGSSSWALRRMSRTSNTDWNDFGRDHIRKASENIGIRTGFPCPQRHAQSL